MDNGLYFVTTAVAGFYPAAIWVTDSAGTRLLATYAADTTLIPVMQYDGVFLYAVLTSTDTRVVATLGTQSSTHVAFDLGAAAWGGITTQAELQKQFAIVNDATIVAGTGLGILGAAVAEAGLTVNSGQTLIRISPQSYLSPETVTDFTTVGTTVFFVDANASGTSRLYATDGTPAGTTSLFAADGIANLTDETGTSQGERLFFTETGGAGDALLEAIAPGATTPTQIGDLGAVSVQSITDAGGTLFIATQDGSGDGALWVSDGSNAAPIVIQDFSATPTEVTASGNDVFFVVGDALWTATPSGATELQAFASIGSLYLDGGTLFFAADDGATGTELWKYAGGAVSLVDDIVPGSGSSDPGNFADLNGALYFSAATPATGTELWVSDGTAGGTRLVDDVNPGTPSSNPTGLTPGPSVADSTTQPLITFQSGDAGGYGGTDGTAAGTFSPSGYASQGRPDALTYTASTTSLTISHGTVGTDITVTLPAAPGIYPNLGSAVVTSNAGGFFDIETTDSGTDNSIYTGLATLYYIANDSLAPLLVETFVPNTVNDIDQISQRVTTGDQEYFLLTEEDGNYKPLDTQLWVSDGTLAGTKEVGDLGDFSDPGNTYPTSINVIAGSFGWAGLLADQSGTVSVWTSPAGGGVADITLASIGLSGTIDNTGNASLGENDGDYLFSLAPTGGGSQTIATDGTVAGTQVIATTASGAFGDFTEVGSLEYFDTGAGGALWVWNGTAATQLLASGAYIAPYSPTTYGTSTPPVASTATVTVGDVTWFYFVAASGASYALERTDGTTVQTVMATGLAQNAYITEAGGLIFFAADSGAGYTTIFVTDPSGASAAPVISPTLYPADSLLGQIYGAPQNPTLLQAVSDTLPAPDTIFLTTGTDLVTGGAGDTTIDGTTNTLTAGDEIDGGGGINDLYLIGAGTFDLANPSTLTNITQVLSSDSGQTITLRQGTTLAVSLAVGSDLGDTIFGADNADTIIGSGDDTITVGGDNEKVSDFGHVIVTAATAGALITDINAGTVEVQGGGAVTLNKGDFDIGTIVLDMPTNLTISNYAFDTVVRGSTGTDTITIATPSEDTGFYVIQPKGGGDTIDILPVDLSTTNPSQIVFYDTAADLNGTTIEGYNFTPYVISSSDTIDITDVAYTAAETVSLVPVADSTNSAFNLVVSPDGGSDDDVSITLTGVPVDGSGDPLGGFIASSDSGSGTRLTYYPNIVTLTAGTDTISATGLTAVLAAAGTLTSGDDLNGGGTGGNTPRATLFLLGAGTFDLALPATLEGFAGITGDTHGQTYGGPAVAQTIILRDGENDTVTLGAGADTVIGADNAASIANVIENLGSTGPGYIIDVGDARETVTLQGYIHDVINVDAATGLTSVTDTLGSYITEGTEVVNGGGVAGVGTADVGTVSLAAPTDAYLVGTAPAVIQGSTGTDLIDATLLGDGLGSAAVTIEPNGGGDTILLPVENAGATVKGTAAQLNDTTLEDYNFLPADDSAGFTRAITINVTDFLNAGSVVVTYVGDVVTISDGAESFDLTMPGLPGAGITSTVTPDSSQGVDILLASATPTTTVDAQFVSGDTSFAGTPGGDTLNVSAGALASGETIDGAGGANELVLNGSGTFDLSAPAVLTDFQALASFGTDQTVILRPGMPLDITANDATIIGADSPDVIALNGGGGNTVTIDNAGATLIDGGINDTISVSAATIGATIYGGHGSYNAQDQDTLDADTLVVTGGGTAVMGDNIVNVPTVTLGQTGLLFYGNDQAGLAITIGDPGTPDTVFAGNGGDTIEDDSTGGNILVGGAGNDLFELGDPQNSSAPTPSGDTIYGFDTAGSDTIYFANVVELDQPVYSNGTLSIDSYGDAVYSVVLAGAYDGSFAGTGDGDGTKVTFAGSETPSGTIPCFAAGTMIQTSHGECAVEDLRIGDRLPVMFGGGDAPIIWIGSREVDCATHADPRQVWPVRVRAHAFGPGRPHRDLFLSPDHAVFTGDVLIPVRYLVDGDAIAHAPVERVTYFHVELPSHNVVQAEGLPVETYLADNNRDSFFGSEKSMQVTDAMLMWEACGCAPLVVIGLRLDEARARVGCSIGARDTPRPLCQYATAAA